LRPGQSFRYDDQSRIAGRCREIRSSNFEITLWPNWRQRKTFVDLDIAIFEPTCCHLPPAVICQKNTALHTGTQTGVGGRWHCSSTWVDKHLGTGFFIVWTVRWVGGLDRSENDNVRIRHMLVAKSS